MFSLIFFINNVKYSISSYIQYHFPNYSNHELLNLLFSELYFSSSRLQRLQMNSIFSISSGFTFTAAHSRWYQPEPRHFDSLQHWIQ